MYAFEYLYLIFMEEWLKFSISLRCLCYHSQDPSLAVDIKSTNLKHNLNWPFKLIMCMPCSHSSLHWLDLISPSYHPGMTHFLFSRSTFHFPNQINKTFLSPNQSANLGFLSLLKCCHQFHSPAGTLLGQGRLWSCELERALSSLWFHIYVSGVGLTEASLFSGAERRTPRFSQ